MASAALRPVFLDEPLAPEEVSCYYAQRAPRLTRHGKQLRGGCPVHGGNDPNFVVELATGLCYCHSQCQRGWNVFSLDRELNGGTYAEAKARVYACIGRGGSSKPVRGGVRNTKAIPTGVVSPRHSTTARGACREEADPIARVKAIWSQTVPLPGTIGAAYLQERRAVDASGLEHVVRFHPSCPWDKGRLPCLVLLIRDVFTDEPCAIHRTALGPDGSKIGRKMLGPAGRGALKLTPDEDVLGGLNVAEGLETALSVLQAGWRPVWALLCSGGIGRLPVLDGIEFVTIWADPDTAGTKAAREAARRWSAAGRWVQIRWPKDAGKDFNDTFREARP